ncbi:MAG: Multidrug resistance protein Stp [Chlamydiia bacterium]|nr:Multidrug resistance protein Stp [Chlamydiia bacterium]MCH9618187.1 Multidrug resistance protein Stp [Chlamydiia bacterium]MCH9624090.1 Multidrug resistance protein Stp [Chlamydiia bacterium]
MGFKFSKDQWLLLAAMICGLAMIFLDASILPVALPTIQRELGISSINLQWIVNVYFLGEASFVILGGKLGDVFGVRRIYIFGLFIFGIASVFGGIASSTTWLLIARSIQGLGAALMTPSITAIIIAKFPHEKRGKAIGISVAIGALFLSFGPFFGGLITEFFTWRWIFFINIFITVLGVVLTLWYVPVYASKRVKIDVISFFLFGGALLMITLGSMEGQRYGWFTYRIIGFLLTGVILAALFYLHYHTSKSKEPFFDFSLFKKIKFFIGNMHVFIVQFILMNSVFWAIFFQLGMGFTPLIAGMWTFFSTVPVLIAAPVAGYLTDRYGAKLPTSIGFVGLTITFVCLTLFASYQYFILMVIGIIVYGFSISQILTPTGTLVISSVIPEKRGLASGIYNTMRFTGAALGMAILGSIYTGTELSHMKSYMVGIHPSLSAKKKTDLEHIYTGSSTKSYQGLDVIKIQKEASKAAYMALGRISILSLALSILGLILVYAEKMKKIFKGAPL